jgi:serine/threonine protein kinase
MIRDCGSIELFSQAAMNEFSIWNRLQHAHIVPLLGVVFGFRGDPYPAAVVPWIEGSDLYSYLDHQIVTQLDKLSIVSFCSLD